MIGLSDAQRVLISEQFASLYTSGNSLSDIAKQTGKAKSTIRETLKRSGLDLRSNISTPITRVSRESGKGNIRPPYGFCYFQGAITPDPREYDNLLLIYKFWSSGTNPNRIADELNKKKIPARSAKKWNRNSIVNILDRFKNKFITLQGGNLELR